MLKGFFVKFYYHWKVLLKDPAYAKSLWVGLFMIFLAVFFIFILGHYNDARHYVSVGDLILDGLPTYNFEWLFTWGYYIVAAVCFLFPMFFKQEIFPFTLKTFGILLIVRSIFNILTNLGPPEGFFYENVDIPFATLTFKNDLFFSGHVSMPFMAFLLFKDSKFKWVMLALIIPMAVTVLGMHVHYSIDVFAAFFITYGIYALSNKIFNDLNVRFKRRINLLGWESVQRRLAKFRERRNKKNLTN